MDIAVPWSDQWRQMNNNNKYVPLRDCIYAKLFTSRINICGHTAQYAWHADQIVYRGHLYLFVSDYFLLNKRYKQVCTKKWLSSFDQEWQTRVAIWFILITFCLLSISFHAIGAVFNWHKQTEFKCWQFNGMCYVYAVQCQECRMNIRSAECKNFNHEKCYHLLPIVHNKWFVVGCLMGLQAAMERRWKHENLMNESKQDDNCHHTVRNE